MIRHNNSLLSVLTILTFISVMPIALSARASTNQTSFEDVSNESADISKLNATAPITQGSKLNVVASFYPIFEFVKQIGGD
jgi:ABC-type Zn uptake system ZnuABC Zn-binding protein ZnuA